MKFHKFHGTEQNKSFSQIMCRIIYPMWQFQVISTNLSVNISFNGLRQNLLNLVSSPSLIWYWKKLPVNSLYIAYLKVGNVQWIISSQKQTNDNSFNDIRTYQ